MPSCVIDGQKIEFKPGQTIIEVAKSASLFIPHFCYHPGLSVVAQCRMCAVEVEKMPKLQTACSTPASDGMVISTKSPKTIQNQQSVMEFLLINHPLDCPICDKSGECDLQDFSFDYGSAQSRYTEERRTYVDLDMGEVIKKNMNRCIHCTRCIRFGDEIAKSREMIAVQRGARVEITTLTGKPLETQYAGNYADLCPTGSLTLKDFRFKKRAWFLQKSPGICDGCSTGCNLEFHHFENKIYRCLPRENQEINRYWLCDEGRFRFKTFQSQDRIREPQLQGKPSTWELALQDVKKQLQSFLPPNLWIFLGSDLTQEEAQEILSFAQQSGIGSSQIRQFGGREASQDGPEDFLLRRLSKTPNVHGLHHLGLKKVTPLELENQPKGVALIFRGGRAQLPELPASWSKIGVGFFEAQEALSDWIAILPGPSFGERSGSMMNFQGKVQHFEAVLKRPSTVKTISEVLMIFLHSKNAESFL